MEHIKVEARIPLLGNKMAVVNHVRLLIRQGHRSGEWDMPGAGWYRFEVTEEPEENLKEENA